MTASTETERAEYERELIDNHHYVPSDFSFKDGFYCGDDDYIQFGWDLWQAARRAPVVPTPSQIAKYLWEKGCVLVPKNVARPHREQTHMNEREVQQVLAAAAPQPPDAGMVPSSMMVPSAACNPSMQPWKDHITAQLVGELTEVARKYHGAQQLRERIAGLVRPLCDRVKQLEADHIPDTGKMVASQEQSNGKQT